MGCRAQAWLTEITSYKMHNPTFELTPKRLASKMPLADLPQENFQELIYLELVIWVVVKIMVPFWVPCVLGAVL